MYQVPGAEGDAKDVAAENGIKGKKKIKIFFMMYEPFFVSTAS